jgi:hypothetical protein
LEKRSYEKERGTGLDHGVGHPSKLYLKGKHLTH